MNVIKITNLKCTEFIPSKTIKKAPVKLQTFMFIYLVFFKINCALDLAISLYVCYKNCIYTELCRCCWYIP